MRVLVVVEVAVKVLVADGVGVNVDVAAGSRVGVAVAVGVGLGDGASKLLQAASRKLKPTANNKAIKLFNLSAIFTRSRPSNYFFTLAI